MLIKIKTIIGCSLIGIALPLFIPYFGMTYGSTIANPTLSLELSLFATRLFFIGFAFFHWPAFVLIGIGIYILIKYSRKDYKTTNILS